MTLHSAQQSLIYQLHITLTGVNPPIWRRLAVPHDISLDRLSLLLQKTVGWSNVHVHEFAFGNTKYGAIEDDEEEFDVLDEQNYRLCDLAPKEGATFLYNYDPKDAWRHDIVVEKITPPEKSVTYPVCLDGARGCPPEDCGGPEGYQHFLDAVLDEAHPDHQEMLDWVEGICDPEDFDLEYTNELLR